MSTLTCEGGFSSKASVSVLPLSLARSAAVLPSYIEPSRGAPPHTPPQRHADTNTDNKREMVRKKSDRDNLTRKKGPKWTKKRGSENGTLNPTPLRIHALYPSNPCMCGCICTTYTTSYRLSSIRVVYVWPTAPSAASTIEYIVSAALVP